MEHSSRSLKLFACPAPPGFVLSSSGENGKELQARPYWHVTTQFNARAFPHPSSPHSDVSAKSSENRNSHNLKVAMSGHCERNKIQPEGWCSLGAEEEALPEIWEPKEEVKGTGELKTPWWGHISGHPRERNPRAMIPRFLLARLDLKNSFSFHCCIQIPLIDLLKAVGLEKSITYSQICLPIPSSCDASKMWLDSPNFYLLYIFSRV